MVQIAGFGGGLCGQVTDDADTAALAFDETTDLIDDAVFFA